MTANVTIRANGKAEIAYVGDKPWHGLGNALEPGQPIETWLTAAGMDWRIQRAKVRYATGHGQDANAWRTMDDRHVLLRSDSGDPLGIVSDDYKVVQPKTVLEFFRDLTANAGFELNTAGTLFGGKRYWALASIGTEATIADSKDRVGGYLLLCTSADGSMATEGRFTTVRVVCNNTLSMARKTRANVKVTHRTQFSASDMKSELGIGIRDQFAETIAQFRQLAARPLAPVQSLELTTELFAPGFAQLDAEKKNKILKSKPVTRVGQLALNRGAMGSGMDGVDGTAWGWLNAVTQYVDHEARAHSQDNRLNSAWFGRGDEMKTRALEMAVATANGQTIYTPVSATVEQAGASVLDDILNS